MIERRIEINAPIETVYQVVSDLEAYPEFLSTTDEVEVSRENGQLEAVFSVNVVKKVSYTLVFTEEAPKRLSWRLKEASFMKKNNGEWELESIDENKTQAKYKIDVEFGWMVPKKLVGMLTETQLPELLRAFTQRAERVAKE